jgi:parvulin-like peptidyl-prolyl isomerase
MKKFVILLLVAFIFIPSGCKKGEKEGTVIARVNSSVFTLEELNEQVPPYLSISPERKKAFVDEWVKTQLVYEEAIKKGIDEDEKTQRKLELLKKQFIANELLSRRLESEQEISDFEVKEYFQEHERDFNSQIKVAHILLTSEEEAKKVLNKLKENGDFINLARTFSEDTLTANNGGLLPRYFRFGEMADTPEFEEAAFSIDKIGGISDIVKTNYGYHIIKLIDRKPTKEKVTIDDIGMQIKQYLTSKKQQATMDTWIDSLKAESDIELHYEKIK